MQLPFRIYDFIVTLFPGVLLLIIIKVELPFLFRWEIANDNLELVLYLIIGYIIGHLIQNIFRIARNISNPIKEKILLNYLAPKPKKKEGIKGKHYPLGFSEPITKEIERAFKDYYGIDPSDLPQGEVFNLVMAAVPDKMNERDIFLAISNFHRGIALVFVIYFIFLCGKVVYITIFAEHLTLNIISTLLLMGFLAFASYLLARGSKSFKKPTDEIPYYAFLSQYKGDKFKK